MKRKMQINIKKQWELRLAYNGYYVRNSPIPLNYKKKIQIHVKQIVLQPTTVMLPESLFYFNFVCYELSTFLCYYCVFNPLISGYWRINETDRYEYKYA